MKTRTLIMSILLLILSFNVFAMGTPPETQKSSDTKNIIDIKEKEYDGIWFLGFNEKKRLFGDEDGRVVRQSFALSINKDIIARIIGDEIVPTGVIPPGMEGHDPTLKGYPYDVSMAKRIMRQIGYPMNDSRIKNLTILHTDGAKTRRIVDRIKMDLIDIGVDMTRIEIPYSNTNKWKTLLSSGKYDMFVMGYKAGSFGDLYISDKDTKIFHTFSCHLNSTNEANQIVFEKYKDAINAGYKPCNICNPTYEKIPKTVALLQPLFHSEGEANFTFFENNRIDSLLNMLTQIDEQKKLYRYELFNEIDRTILDECVVVPLFYITRL